MADEILNAVVKVGTDIRGLQSGMKKAQKSIGGFQKGAQRLGQSLGGIFAGAMILRGLKNLGKIFMDFESQMSDVKSITGATDDEMKTLSNTAQKLGSTTKFTATEVGQLEKEFAKLGFSTKEIINASEATLDLAAATGTDLARAAEITGSNIRAFGLSTKETGRVVNVFAAATSQSALDMEKLAISLSTVAPVAKNAGFNIEQTVGMLGKLVDAGIDASTAGTGLRNIFLELSKQGLTLDQALQKIRGATDKNLVAFNLFGKRGATVGTVLAENQELAEELTESITGTAAASEMAATQLDNLAGDLTIAKSAWQGFILRIEDGKGIIGKSLRSIVQGFTKLFASSDMMSKSIIEEKIALNGLVTAATSAANTTETRNGFIKDLQKQYPAFLKNLDTEKVTNEQLRDRLRDINIEYDKKISLAAQEELGLYHQKQQVALLLKEKDLIKAISKSTKYVSNIKGERILGFEYKKNIKALEETRKKQHELNEELALDIQMLSLMQAEVDKLVASGKKLTVIDPLSGLDESVKVVDDGISKLSKKTNKTLAPSLTLTKQATEGIIIDFEKLTEAGKMVVGSIQSINTEGIKSFNDFANAVVGSIKGVIGALIAEGVTHAILGILKNPIIAATPGLNMTLASAAGVGASALFQNLVPSFAEGGATAFSKPTLTMLGDTPGVSRSNPEIMGNAKQLSGMFGGGGNVVFKIEDRYLVGILDQYTKRKGAFS